MEKGESKTKYKKKYYAGDVFIMFSFTWRMLLRQQAGDGTF